LILQFLDQKGKGGRNLIDEGALSIESAHDVLNSWGVQVYQQKDLSPSEPGLRMAWFMEQELMGRVVRNQGEYLRKR
jgi:predicted Rossmann fold nucleotide-binding protein DprA/Smf involved in DNA uptake